MGQLEAQTLPFTLYAFETIGTPEASTKLKACGLTTPPHPAGELRQLIVGELRLTVFCQAISLLTAFCTLTRF